MTLTSPAAPARIEPPAGKAWLPIAAAVTTLLLWASAFVAIRHLGKDVPPGALSLGRLLVASLALGVLVFRRPRRWPARRDWPLLLLCGVAWFGIYNLALNESERRIDAGTAALIVQIGPIIVALLATVFLGELLHRWLLVGMVVGFAGVVVIAQGSADGGSSDLVGVVLAVGGRGGLRDRRTRPEAVAGQASRTRGHLDRVPHRRGDLPAVDGRAGRRRAHRGDLARCCGSSTSGSPPPPSRSRPGPTRSSARDAGTLSLTTFLVPLIATGIAWFLLDEVPPALAFAGGALCIVGVRSDEAETAGCLPR